MIRFSIRRLCVCVCVCWWGGVWVGGWGGGGGNSKGLLSGRRLKSAPLGNRPIREHSTSQSLKCCRMGKRLP